MASFVPFAHIWWARSRTVGTTNPDKSGPLWTGGPSQTIARTRPVFELHLQLVFSLASA